MKSKESVFYIVIILSLTLLVRAPVIADSMIAQDAPLTNLLSKWLAYGENFVNSRVFATVY